MTRRIRWRHRLLVGVFACALAVMMMLQAQRSWALGSTLYGTDQAGELFSINVVTGAGALVGTLPITSAEIECQPSAITPTCFVHGFHVIQQFNPATAAGIGAPASDGFVFTGLEYVGGTLYGTEHGGSGGGPSNLRILNPFTGTSTLIGATGVGPISGLAFDTVASVMYGIAGGPGPANFYTINLSSGAATVVGNTGIQAGSLQFGPDGNLYAGGTGFPSNPDSGKLFRIDKSTGAAAVVGPTGFVEGVTGLTLLSPAPAPAPALSEWGMVLAFASLMLLGVYRLRARGPRY